MTVTTTDDAVVEPDETLRLNLTSASDGATISTSQATGTITNNDLPPPSFSVSGTPTATEGGALQFTVTKTGSTNTSFSVTFATSSDSAISGSDFTPVSETLVFGTNDTLRTMTVMTIDDTDVESAETLLVGLSSPSGGATIGTAQASGTINDNDFVANTPPVAVTDYLTMPICQFAQVNVLNNDTDADGDLPLTLLSAEPANSAALTVAFASGGMVDVTSGNSAGSFGVNYVVRDSRGATKSGQLTVTVQSSMMCAASRPEDPTRDP